MHWLPLLLLTAQLYFCYHQLSRVLITLYFVQKQISSHVFFYSDDKCDITVAPGSHCFTNNSQRKYAQIILFSERTLGA